MYRQEDVVNALEALGNTPQEVAQTLLAGGFKGGRSSCDCPIAVLLLSKFPPDSTIDWRVSGYEITLGNAGHCDVLIENSSPIRQFIRMYDNDEFMELRLPDPKKDKKVLT